MTCKDCLLRPMCFAVREIGEKDRCAEHCPKFKNKADFVRVVRCKDCAYRYTKYCNAKHERADMDYCSSGDEK